MKITIKQLKQIIKEETQKIMSEPHEAGEVSAMTVESVKQKVTSDLEGAGFEIEPANNEPTKCVFTAVGDYDEAMSLIRKSLGTLGFREVSKSRAGSEFSFKRFAVRAEVRYTGSWFDKKDSVYGDQKLYGCKVTITGR